MTLKNREEICSEIFSTATIKVSFVLSIQERKKFKALRLIHRWRRFQIPILPYSLLLPNIVRRLLKPWLKKKTQKHSSLFQQVLEKATNKEKSGKKKSQPQSIV